MKTETVHATVSQAYTEALARSQAQAGGCCGPNPCSAAVVSAGYGDEMTAFADAGASSFGCGNPLAFADVRPGQTVLDLGSGAGFDLLIAAQRVGPQGKVIGVDMTDAMIAAARDNVMHAGADQIEVRKGVIEALPVASASVDHVISNCVINLSPEKQKVFSEIARVLKPGGAFRISDIVAEPLPAWIRDHAAAYAACVAGAISEADYVAGLRAAGLQDVYVTQRTVYTAAQIRALIANDFESLGLSPELLHGAFAEVEGKVWSATVVGLKPATAKCCCGADC